jgi:hypothetical protein
MCCSEKDTAVIDEITLDNCDGKCLTSKFTVFLMPGMKNSSQSEAINQDIAE